MLNEQAIDFNYLQRIICFDGQICMVANDIKKQQENKGLTSLYVIIENYEQRVYQINWCTYLHIVQRYIS